MGLALPIYADPHNYLDISNKMAMALKLSEAEKQAKIAKQLELASNFTWQITAEKTLTIIKNTVKGL